MPFEPVEPEDAATVILLRESAGGLEVYMTKRQGYLPFLGGYYVFPGGKVDESDRDESMFERCRSLSPEEAAGRMDGVADHHRAMGFFVAGARELFEESGILLAANGSGEVLESPAPSRLEGLEKKRDLLQKDRIAFSAILEQERLFIDPSRLLWFAHWVTPATSPRRFSTHFFVARKPEGQEPTPFREEVAEEVWCKPEEAIARWKQGDWRMIPPTIASLDTISRYQSWREIKKDFSLPPGEHQRTVWRGE